MRYLLILLLTTVTFAAKPFTVESFLSELSDKGAAKHERLIKKNQEKLQQLSDENTYTLINALADSGWGETISHCKTYLIPIDAFSAKKKTALQNAFLTGEYDKAKLLIQSGCDPTVRLQLDKDGLFYHAIYHQKFELLKALIDAGVNPNTTAGEGINYYVKKDATWADSSSNLWKKDVRFLDYILTNSTAITKLPTPLIEYLIKKLWNSHHLFLLVKHGIITEQAHVANLHTGYLKKILPYHSSTNLDPLFAHPTVLHATHKESTPILEHLLKKRSINIKPELLDTYLDSINCSYETFNKEGKNHLMELITQGRIQKKHKPVILKRIKPEKLKNYYSDLLTMFVSRVESKKDVSFLTLSDNVATGLSVDLKPNFDNLPDKADPLLYFLSNTIHLYPRRKQRYTEFLEMLVKSVNELNAQDNQGRTPLMWAQLLPKGNPLEKMLLNAGAKELDEEYWGE